MIVKIQQDFLSHLKNTLSNCSHEKLQQLRDVGARGLIKIDDNFLGAWATHINRAQQPTMASLHLRMRRTRKNVTSARRLISRQRDATLSWKNNIDIIPSQDSGIQEGATQELSRGLSRVFWLFQHSFFEDNCACVCLNLIQSHWVPSKRWDVEKTTQEQLSKKGEKRSMKWNYSISLSFRPKKWMISSRGHASPGTGSVMWTDAIFCIRLRTQELFISPSFHCWFFISMNVSCTTREHKNRTRRKKNLFFYFHKFNFLLLFPAFVRRMRRECAEDTRTFTSSSSFFFDLVLSVIFGKNENASKEDKKHRIRFRANLLLCLAFNIFFRVLFVKLTGDDDDGVGNICRFLIISVCLRLEILLQQSEERREKKVKEKGRKNLSLEWAISGMGSSKKELDRDERDVLVFVGKQQFLLFFCQSNFYKGKMRWRWRRIVKLSWSVLYSVYVTHSSQYRHIMKYINFS